MRTPRINKAVEEARSRRAQRHPAAVTPPAVIVRHPSNSDAGVLAAWRLTSDAALDRRVASDGPHSQAARVRRLRDKDRFDG